MFLLHMIRSLCVLPIVAKTPKKQKNDLKSSVRAKKRVDWMVDTLFAPNQKGYNKGELRNLP
ncbi:hypothetical protein CHM34_05710 [Paludifilum halophilum]|uniref:Uncharacterized protein n=1 Tax=Paludifilum halophilum TaxID=1642702 RepID=A0A235B7W1_9BACL|nr:hypothetical protein CHM34_05710 [Paludifilum halophilum]